LVGFCLFFKHNFQSQFWGLKCFKEVLSLIFPIYLVLAIIECDFK
jgi:hypothetical protein